MRMCEPIVPPKQAQAQWCASFFSSSPMKFLMLSILVSRGYTPLSIFKWRANLQLLFLADVSKTQKVREGSRQKTFEPYLELAHRGTDSLTFWRASFMLLPEGAGASFLPPVAARTIPTVPRIVPKESYSFLIARPKIWLY